MAAHGILKLKNERKPNMRRSEMVQEIASQVVMEHVEIDWAQAQRLADIILKQIEYHGMLPPSYEARYPKSRNKLDGSTMIVHEWETETNT